MHILGLPQRKYVYPTIMLIGLFLLLLMRYASSADSLRPEPPDRHRDGVDLFRDTDNEFINASERFNESIRNSRDDSLDGRIQRQEERVRNLETRWRNSSPGYYSNAAVERMNSDFRNDLYIENNTDNRYSAERRRLDGMRSKELNDYRDRRQELQNSMTGYNRNSDEYEHLERQLNTLDRSHAEERRFEREFRNMDANYSTPRR